MQILTDRKVHNYKLPDGWLMAACINPDNGNYSVNTMDTALKNRFEVFDIKYDQRDFLSFMKADNYDPNIISFVENGHWVFKSLDELGEEGFYISPRTFSKLNAARLSEIVKTDEDIHHEVCVSTLGKGMGVAFHKYVHELKPLVAKDFTGKKLDKSLEKLAKYSDPNSYRGDLLNITATSVSDEFGLSISDETLAKIAAILPADIAVGLLTDSFVKIKNKVREGKVKAEVKTFKEWIKAYPTLEESLKSRLKGSYGSTDVKEGTKK